MSVDVDRRGKALFLEAGLIKGDLVGRYRPVARGMRRS
jgi:hypothetical protein